VVVGNVCVCKHRMFVLAVQGIWDLTAALA